MKEHTQNEQAENTGPPAHNWPALTVDWDMLGQCLEDSDLSDAEIRETIEAYWALSVAIVDLSLGIHPAQMATKSACEHNGQNGSLNTDLPINLVHCLTTSSEQPNLQPSFKPSLADFAVKANVDGSAKKERKSQKEGSLK